jgi:ribosomal protein L18E
MVAIDKEINGIISTRVEQLLPNKSEDLYQRQNSKSLELLSNESTYSINDKIQETVKTPTKSTKETINLYRVYMHIKMSLKIDE